MNKFKRTIKSSGAFSLIISIIVFSIFYLSSFASLFFTIKFATLSSLYILLSLISQDYRPLQHVIFQVWEINKVEEKDLTLKIGLIRNYLERAVSKWYKYWRQYQAVVNDEKKYNKRWKKLKAYFEQIINGEIRIGQIFWIFGYMSYSIIISANIMKILEPYDFLVNIAFFIIILFASGGIRGIGSVMKEIFETVKIHDEVKLETKLRSLEKCIIEGTHAYYFFDLDNDNNGKKKKAKI